MTESEIQSLIRLALSPYGIVFRTNAGEYWQGRRVYSKEFQCDVLINLRRVDGLPAGFSDLLFVGENKVAFIECKAPKGAIRPEQINFIQQMQSMGHAVGIARSVEEALTIIRS